MLTIYEDRGTWRNIQRKNLLHFQAALDSEVQAFQELDKIIQTLISYLFYSFQNKKRSTGFLSSKANVIFYLSTCRDQGQKFSRDLENRTLGAILYIVSNTMFAELEKKV